jgi:hypothetical protein
MLMAYMILMEMEIQRLNIWKYRIAGSSKELGEYGHFDWFCDFAVSCEVIFLPL